VELEALRGQKEQIEKRSDEQIHIAKEQVARQKDDMFLAEREQLIQQKYELMQVELRKLSERYLPSICLMQLIIIFQRGRANKGRTG
jgi:hypothetical protein